jgi:hypothetical protein
VYGLEVFGFLCVLRCSSTVDGACVRDCRWKRVYMVGTVG